MKEMANWIYRRQCTLTIAFFFVTWYALQLGVLQLYGEDVALWWFYFETPLFEISPGMVFGPISHNLNSMTHLAGNLLFLIIAGGLAEPYIGKDRILKLVIGLGYLGTYIANVTVIIHLNWIVAGASGGIFALVAYAGVRMGLSAFGELRSVNNGITFTFSQKFKLVFAIFLLILTPVILVHETLYRVHSGHAIGIILGSFYYLVEFYLGSTEVGTIHNVEQFW